MSVGIALAATMAALKVRFHHVHHINTEQAAIMLMSNQPQNEQHNQQQQPSQQQQESHQQQHNQQQEPSQQQQHNQQQESHQQQHNQQQEPSQQQQHNQQESQQQQQEAHQQQHNQQQVSHQQHNQQDPEQQRQRVIALDVRSVVEFNLSHLPGAVLFLHGMPAQQLRSQLIGLLEQNGCKKTLGLSCQLVCYCSVGYRSSLVAARINAMKTDLCEFSYHAVNMDGSIFKWAIEGRALVDMAGRSTSQIHPFNRTFARMIDPALWTLPE